MRAKIEECRKKVQKVQQSTRSPLKHAQQVKGDTLLQKNSTDEDNPYKMRLDYNKEISRTKGK